MTTIIGFLLVTVEVITCALLLGVILIQRTRSQGVGMAFGSGMGESLFGGQVGNVLTRATVVLGAIFLLNTSLLAILNSHKRVEETSVIDSARLPPAAPAMPPPARPGAGLPSPLSGRAPLALPAQPTAAAAVPAAPVAAEPVPATPVATPAPDATPAPTGPVVP